MRQRREALHLRVVPAAGGVGGGRGEGSYSGVEDGTAADGGYGLVARCIKNLEFGYEPGIDLTKPSVDLSRLSGMRWFSVYESMGNSIPSFHMGAVPSTLIADDARDSASLP